MIALHVLRVFVGPDGRGGNPLGVFLDGPGIEPDRRQAVAAELGFSETVFVDEVDAEGAVIRIFTPAAELAFAGHPTVGTAWLLAEQGSPGASLRVRAGSVPSWSADGLTWVRARAAWVHEFERVRYATAADVDALAGPPGGSANVYAWAWEDEAAGRLRARYFPLAFGIAEDEATGAAAVVMGHELGRPLVIHQGVGSEIIVRPDDDDVVAIGGRVVLDDIRPFD
jgi:predicted PhzF superfamily epimerase YddE/YHI9